MFSFFLKVGILLQFAYEKITRLDVSSSPVLRWIYSKKLECEAKWEKMNGYEIQEQFIVTASIKHQ